MCVFVCVCFRAWVCRRIRITLWSYRAVDTRQKCALPKVSETCCDLATTEQGWWGTARLWRNSFSTSLVKYAVLVHKDTLNSSVYLRKNILKPLTHCCASVSPNSSRTCVPTRCGMYMKPLPRYSALRNIVWPHFSQVLELVVVLLFYLSPGRITYWLMNGLRMHGKGRWCLF
jgi:hypothetical protein